MQTQCKLMGAFIIGDATATAIGLNYNGKDKDGNHKFNRIVSN